MSEADEGVMREIDGVGDAARPDSVLVIVATLGVSMVDAFGLRSGLRSDKS